jgi:prolyl-tRNA editing enzyme YbaK/EbsC (Cys-tRNA(Pro) deacylase)
VSAFVSAFDEFEVRRYPEGTRTAADAAAAIGCDVAAIVKSLVFVVEGVGSVLALTSGANVVDVGKLGAHFGGAARKAKADEARAATGYTIGGTPPFAHSAPLPTVCDPSLLDHAEVWAAAGTPDSVFAIAPADLLTRTNATVVDMCLDP